MRPALYAALAVLLCCPASFPDAPPAPVVVELFTSEGCSDCPPADALLAELDREQPVPGALVIPLEEHVDYWDHQGWRDPFSSSAFTARQEQYVKLLDVASPYTPQIVVGGHWDVLGSASGRVRAAIAQAARAPHAEVSLEVGRGTSRESTLQVAVKVGPLPSEVRESVVALIGVTEDELASAVSRGENAGRQLAHRAVVRVLEKLQTPAASPPAFHAELKLAAGWKRENLRVVAFLQGASTGQIYGAATTRVSP